ncbi:MAG: hypothetical protein NW220_15030 [Leptolyngbyaceae cyanobacterium bins.349]|nr:hypothetical protein [Leptolyngbyaceae cyanobacterium bins.349]
MKLFKRQNSAKTLGKPAPEAEGHPEPRGHVHPNYRHLTWFHPGDAQTDAR